MLSLQDYLNEFSPSQQGKERFMALSSAVLSQAADLLAFLPDADPSPFLPQSASGAWLACFGSLVNLDRPASTTTDDDYRELLLARAALMGWDGTNGTIPDVLAAAFPGRTYTYCDNMDGTVTATLENAAWPLEDLFPRPAGVRLIEGS